MAWPIPGPEMGPSWAVMVLKIGAGWGVRGAEGEAARGSR